MKSKDESKKVPIELISLSDNTHQVFSQSKSLFIFLAKTRFYKGVANASRLCYYELCPSFVICTATIGQNFFLFKNVFVIDRFRLFQDKCDTLCVRRQHATHGQLVGRNAGKYG